MRDDSESKRLAGMAIIDEIAQIYQGGSASQEAKFGATKQGHDRFYIKVNDAFLDVSFERRCDASRFCRSWGASRIKHWYLI